MQLSKLTTLATFAAFAAMLATTLMPLDSMAQVGAIKKPPRTPTSQQACPGVPSDVLNACIEALQAQACEVSASNENCRVECTSVGFPEKEGAKCKEVCYNVGKPKEIPLACQYETDPDFAKGNCQDYLGTKWANCIGGK